MFNIRLRETLTRSTHGLFPSWIKAILSRSDPGENFLHKTISIDHRFKYFDIFYFILILNFLFIINKKKRNQYHQENIIHIILYIKLLIKKQMSLISHLNYQFLRFNSFFNNLKFTYSYFFFI